MWELANPIAMGHSIEGPAEGLQRLCSRQRCKRKLRRVLCTSMAARGGVR
jgi:hypothetical protein